MNRLWYKASAVLLVIFMLFLAFMIPRASAAPSVSASGYCLMECETGEVIDGANMHSRLPMASTTKIMTALLTIENCSLDSIAVVPEEAVGIEGSSIHLENSESIKIKDLLYGLMLASGNDAAAALAIHISGNTEAFAELMNKRAGEIGLNDTRFVTPNGLHAEGHYTTAYDLCLLAREAIKNEEFLKVVSSKYYTSESGNRTRTFKNKNTLLWSCEGAFGIKTGYTSAAGRCLVFGAERSGMTVVGALLNCRPMFAEAEKLLDYAFENCFLETVIEEGSFAGKTFVVNSSVKVLELETKNSIMALMPKDSARRFRCETYIPGQVSAPLQKGDSVGLLRIYEGDDFVGGTELVAACGVPEDAAGKGLLFWISASLKAFIQN